MRSGRLFLVAALAACGAFGMLAAPRGVRAKERLGKTYKNKAEGYSLRIPAGWNQIPTQPNEERITAKFGGESNFGYAPNLEVLRWKVKVETPPPSASTGGGKPGEDEGGGKGHVVRVIRMGPENLDQWLESFRKRVEAMGEFKIVREGKITSRDRVVGRQFEASAGSIFYSIGGFRYGGTEFAVVYSCHERDRRGAQKTFASSLRSFQRLEGGGDAAGADAGAEAEADVENFGGTDEQLQRRLEARKGLPAGWSAFDSEHYVCLYNANRSLVKRLAQHIEGIRKQLYEKIFPPDKPIEAISVVRICKDRATYLAYGGPPGSAGYWNNVDEELVFYEDQNNVRDSFAVLYHEAFHQYIFYSVGDISPHTWYNEGHGDYFAGAKYRNGRFRIRKFQWRLSTFKNMQATGAVFPIEKFIRMTQAQYYAQARNAYAQGWAFVYFLREEARVPAWKRILPTYFDTLKTAVANVSAGKTPDGKSTIPPGGPPREGWRGYHHMRGWGALADTLWSMDPQEGGRGGGGKPPAGAGRGKKRSTPKAALEHALKVAFDGVDLEKLEKAFLRAM